jgi:hypothetical protein
LQLRCNKTIIITEFLGIMVKREANMLINLAGGLTAALHWFPHKFGIKRAATGVRGMKEEVPVQ